MCVLSQNFGNKVTFYNLFYCNSMRYSILYEINQAKLILERVIWSKKPKNAKNTVKTCVFFWRGRSRDTKILNLIYHQSTIHCRSNKKKLGPYLLINYFKIKILKYLIFLFRHFL